MKTHWTSLIFFSFSFFLNQSSANLVKGWNRYFRKRKGGKEVETVCLDNEQVKSLSPVRLSATPWTAARQSPPSMGFPRQEY